VPLAGEIGRFFNTPRAMTEAEIHGVIERFAYAAGVAKEAGFGGVQVHGAHGYLVSQFLSAHHNVRTDGWGGSPENRRRFAVEVYRAIRARVGAAFPVGIKLNSADFQRGGFTEDESMAVVDALAAEGVDLIEVSGGTYEAPAMTGYGAADAAASTRARAGGLFPGVRGEGSGPNERPPRRHRWLPRGRRDARRDVLRDPARPQGARAPGAARPERVGRGAQHPGGASARQPCGRGAPEEPSRRRQRVHLVDRQRAGVAPLDAPPGRREGPAEPVVVPVPVDEDEQVRGAR